MHPIEKCSTAFIETMVDDEVVIVSLDQGKFYSLKDTGLAIWQMIDGRRTRSQILAELCSEYDASRETLEGDLDSFLADVASAGFVRLRA